MSRWRDWDWIGGITLGVILGTAVGYRGSTEKGTVVVSCETTDRAIGELAASHKALVASQTQWYEHIEGEILRHERWLSANDRRIESAQNGHANIMSAISSSEQRVMEELENWRSEQ